MSCQAVRAPRAVRGRPPAPTTAFDTPIARPHSGRNACTGKGLRVGNLLPSSSCHLINLNGFWENDPMAGIARAGVGGRAEGGGEARAAS